VIPYTGINGRCSVSTIPIVTTYVTHLSNYRTSSMLEPGCLTKVTNPYSNRKIEGEHEMRTLRVASDFGFYKCLRSRVTRVDCLRDLAEAVSHVVAGCW
jgi:hypothetical protein